MKPILRTLNLELGTWNSFWVGFLLTVASCSPDTKSASADQYTCPMHPTVISDKQGACPVCGMDLVRKARAGEEIKITPELAKRTTAPNQAVLSNIRTVKGVFESRPVTVTTQGKATYDTRYLQALAARMGGRLERVFIKYTGQTVRQGEKVAELYSPELETAERELIFLIDHDNSNTELISASKQKLSLLGSSDEEIEGLLKSKTTDGRFNLFSPASGYVVGSDSDDSKKEVLREGDYVSTGQLLFNIASSRAIRLEFSLATTSTASIRVGQPIDVAINDGRNLQGTIDFIQPFFQAGESFQKVRVYVKGADFRIGQLVVGTLREKSREALWIPREAVTNLGKESVVFVKDRSGMFRPRPVKVGARSEGWVEILQGLASAEEIAEDAAFLVDSEGFVSIN